MARIILTLKVLFLIWIAHSLIFIINPIWWINTILISAAAGMLFVAYQVIMSMWAKPVEPRQQPQLNTR